MSGITMAEAKKFDLNIEKILEDWEVYDAVREIVANAMDEELITDTDKIKIFKDNEGRWHIKDYGRGLRYEHLTQKEDEEKLTNPNVIGKFGIGLKDALATFDRKGVKVLIKSRYGDITIAKSEKHEFEDIITLHAYINHPSDTNLVGTEIILDGCSTEDIQKAKDLFLRFSGEKLLEETQYGQALEKKEDFARIYINGVKVAEEENFIFSYNITSLTKAIRKALNRERSNVGRSAYSGRVKSILLSCKSKTIANKLVDDLKNYQIGTIHDEMKWMDVNIHACKLLNSFENVVFFTPEELIFAKDTVDKAKNDGYEIVTIPNNIKHKISGLKDASGNLIRDLDQFNVEWNESFEFKFIDKTDMIPQERKIFELTNEILNFIGGKPKNVKEIKISETMRMESVSFREAVGLWEGNRIIIKRDQLRSLEQYAGTLLHEIVHAISGASDISSKFELQLTSLIGKIISRTIVDSKRFSR
jgi:hypothetical protein